MQPRIDFTRSNFQYNHARRLYKSTLHWRALLNHCTSCQMQLALQVYFPDEQVQRLGNFNQLMAVYNREVVFGGVGYFLAIDMAGEPLRRYSHGEPDVSN